MSDNESHMGVIEAQDIVAKYGGEWGIPTVFLPPELKGKPFPADLREALDYFCANSSEFNIEWQLSPEEERIPLLKFGEGRFFARILRHKITGDRHLIICQLDADIETEVGKRIEPSIDIKKRSKPVLDLSFSNEHSVVVVQGWLGAVIAAFNKEKENGKTDS